MTNFEGELCAVLQLRGAFNPETMKRHSFPGGAQVTCHGKCEKEEIFSTTLKREIREELGEHFFQFFRKHFVFTRFPKLFSFIEEDVEKKTFGIFIKDPNFLKKIQLYPGTGGIVLIKKEQLSKIKDLTEFNKEIGIIDRRIIAMFPDEKKALEKAFDLFS